MRSAGAHHSHTFYNWFANTPGLKVVLPATPYDLKGLFKTALREPGPVAVIEHKSLYNTKGMVPEEEYLIPFGDARIVREGKDLTIVAMSKMGELAAKAADSAGRTRHLSRIDRPPNHRSPRPEKITSSIKKTGRLVVSTNRLHTAVLRVNLLRSQRKIVSTNSRWPRRNLLIAVPNPFSPVLENQMIPSVDRIIREVNDMMKQPRRKC